MKNDNKENPERVTRVLDKIETLHRTKAVRLTIIAVEMGLSYHTLHASVMIRNSSPLAKNFLKMEDWLKSWEEKNEKPKTKGKK